jgi:hypothetical protein
MAHIGVAQNMELILGVGVALLAAALAAFFATRRLNIVLRAAIAVVAVIVTMFAIVVVIWATVKSP